MRKQSIDDNKNLITKKVGTSGKDVTTIRNAMDYYIGRLIHKKTEIEKVRDYYYGTRDNKDYAYLEDNKGIGNPIDLKLTPLLKSRIDIIVGLMLTQNLTPQVFAVDKDTISKEEIEQVDFISNLSQGFQNKIIEQGVTPEIKKEITDAIDNINGEEFVSSFQKSAQHIVNFYLDNTEINFDTFKEIIFRNLLLYAETIYKESVISKNEYPTLEPCLPEDTFFLKGKGKRDISTSKAIVHRLYMTKQQALVDLGRYMNKVQKKEFLKDQTIVQTGDAILKSRSAYINQVSYEGSDMFNAKDYSNYQQYMADMVEVIHVEYKEAEEIEITPSSFDDYLSAFIKGTKKEKRMIESRFSGYRIGNFYYLNLGKDIDAKRNILNPSKVEFSYHGISFNEFKKPPTSIGYGLIDINDKMDIMKYMRDNLVANSGGNGSRINVAAIPYFMGDDMFERVDTFLAYSKQGLQMIDPTQPGSKQNDFAQYGDFDNTVSAQALGSIDAILNRLDMEADLIAGINAQMRGVMEEREAVGNVKTGITMISYATKHYFSALDLEISKGLSLLLDNVKLSFPSGMYGSYNIGVNKQVFKIIPGMYLPSRMIVAIKRDDTDILELQRLKGIVQEMGSGGFMDPENVILANTAKSVQELQEVAISGVAKKRNDLVDQLKQQLEQSGEAIAKYEKDIDKMSKTIDALNKKNLDIETRKVDVKVKEVDANIAIEQDRLSADRERDLKHEENIKERTQIERVQAETQASGNAAEVRNID